MGRPDSFKSWLNTRTQDPIPTPPHPRLAHLTPPLWTSNLLKDLEGVPHSGPPTWVWTRHSKSQPYLPLPILLDAPNDSAQNFCGEVRGRLRMPGPLAPPCPQTFWVPGWTSI